MIDAKELEAELYNLAQLSKELESSIAPKKRQPKAYIPRKRSKKIKLSIEKK